MLPPDQYVASLARKRMAVTAFFRDRRGRVLLVNPVYKQTWDLPGGAVEAEESPHAACRREVVEELGLDRPPGRVLAVDWVPSRPERPEGLRASRSLPETRAPANPSCGPGLGAPNHKGSGLVSVW
jgi:8-oxo-dGTP diphosphatase